MRNGSVLVRDKDQKHFVVTDLGHWSTIQADDGEQDSVKWYGQDGEAAAYISSRGKGSYRLRDEAK